MKAAIKTGFLGTTISFSETLPMLSKPKDKDSVLVKVHAGAINPVDYKLPRFAAPSAVVGLDFCGTVEEAHPQGDFKAGDLVFGKCKGSLAEYSLASSKEIARAPSDLEATDIAALPIAYLSALQCLRKGKILPNDENAKNKSVLIIGASGGCGLAGVHLCAGMGVGRIVGICSSRNAAFVQEHGVTEVVDYSNEVELEKFFEQNAGKFDCVYDTATNSGGGEDYWEKSLSLLKKNEDGEIVGEYTALNGSAGKWMRALSGTQKEHETIIMTDTNGPDLELVVQLMEKAEAKPITKIFSFDEEGIRDGFKLLKSRRTKGKIVFDISAASGN